MCGPFITPIYYRGILLIVFIAEKYIGDKTIKYSRETINLGLSSFYLFLKEKEELPVLFPLKKE